MRKRKNDFWFAFDLLGIALPLGLAINLVIPFMIAYFSGVESFTVYINTFREVTVEMFLFPIIILWGVITFVRVAKREW